MGATTSDLRRNLGEKGRGVNTSSLALFHQDSPSSSASATPGRSKPSSIPLGDFQSSNAVGSRAQQNIADLTNSEGTMNSDDPAAIPALIQRLNRAIAKLPPGGVGKGDAEEPPEYYAE